MKKKLKPSKTARNLNKTSVKKRTRSARNVVDLTAQSTIDEYFPDSNSKKKEPGAQSFDIYYKKSTMGVKEMLS